MENNKKPYGRVYMTKLCRYFFRRYGLILLLLFAHPVIATMEGLDQVDFYGMGNSKGKTLTITFVPDTPLYMISDENVNHILHQTSCDIENILPLTYIRRAATPKPRLFEEIDWATMFAFSASFANFVEVAPKGSVHNDLQFAAEDPLFGRVSGHTFRFDRYQTLTQGTVRVIRLIFLQQDAAPVPERHSIYIELHVAVPEPADLNHIPFVVHAVRFNRGGQPVDGFQTLENIAAIEQAKVRAKQKRDSDGDQSKKEPEPPSKKDPPEGSGKEGKTGLNKRHWQFSSGGGGGGCSCSMVQLFIMATLLIIPSGQQVLFNPDKA